MRKEVNVQIRKYWDSLKGTLGLKKIRKNKVPSFTRHNGNRILRLGEGWRYPKGSKGNKLTIPSIGYKRPSKLRFRRCVDGVLIHIVHSLKQLLNLKLLPYEVVQFGATVGGAKRKVLLQAAMERNIPVYITKKR